MARITYVKKAQQRYAQKPVIDPATGEQKRVPVMSKRTGQQKVTKRGRPVFMDVTVDDRDRPLANLRCESCGNEIAVGQPYKHVTPKSGPYGGRKRVRCSTCPTWQPWDLSSALWARVAQITDGFNVDGMESAEDVQSAMQDIAEQVRELAEEKRESASNIEDGFGHSTYVSDELNETADQLESWADDIENADIPDYPEGGQEIDCEDCDGTGKVENPEYDMDAEESEDNEEEIDCERCEGTGQVESEDATDEQIDEWHDAVQDAIQIVNDCPVG